MAPEPDGGGGLYSSESAQNTTTDWLDDFKPVEAKLDGMVDYGKALITIQMNLAGHTARVFGQINNLVSGGAFAGDFPEVNYAMQLHSQNLNEFSVYLQNLDNGIYHIANAAKAIADSYGEQDGFSAISLDAINFAFGEPGATRPSGLPKQIGQTFSQQEDAAASAGKTDKNRAAPIWVPTDTTINPDGGMTVISKDQYGEVQTIVISYDANGHQITTTTNPSGKTVSDSITTTNPFGSYTTTTTTTTTAKDPKGTVTTSSSDTNDTGNVVTTDDGKNGVVDQETVLTYNDDGSQNTAVYAVSNGKRTTVESSISVGQDNIVDNGLPDSPAQDAIDQVQAGMPKPSGPKTVILAPGEPGTNYSDGSSTSA
jgi:hypothetical protein